VTGTEVSAAPEDATGPAPRLAVDSARFLVLAATAVLALSFLLPTAVRWVLTPAVLLLPGHAFVCAAFGRRLEFGGVRRVALSALLSLVTYPILALAVSGLSVPMSHTTVAVSTWLFVGACAAVVARRRIRTARGVVTDDVPPSGYRPQLDWRQLVVPGLAMAAALLVVWAGVQYLPRKPPTTFSAASFAGPWALIDGVVPADPGTDPVVELRVDNRTTSAERYTVEARVVDGPDWSGGRLDIPAGGSHTTTVTGMVPAGACRAKVEVRVRPSNGPALDPLTLYVRDRTASCPPTAAGS
jgi:hypothetical protein